MKLGAWLMIGAALGGCGGQSVGGEQAGGAGRAGQGAGGAASSNDEPASQHEAGAAGAGEVEPIAVWDETSASLLVTSGTSFNGFFRYTRTRAQLSPEQIAALSAMRADAQTTTSDPSCTDADGGTTITVKATDGSETTFVDNSCGVNGHLIDGNGAGSFAGKLPCFTRERTAFELASAPTLTVGDGCEDLIVASDTWTDEPLRTWVRLVVPTAHVPVLIELLGCNGKGYHFDLMDAAAGAVLQSGFTNPPTCQLLVHTFDEAGDYVLRLGLDKGAEPDEPRLRAN